MDHTGPAILESVDVILDGLDQDVNNCPATPGAKNMVNARMVLAFALKVGMDDTVLCVSNFVL